MSRAERVKRRSGGTVELGERLQAALDGVQRRAAAHAYAPALLGAALGLCVMLGGLGAFLIVLALLVGVIR